MAEKLKDQEKEESKDRTKKQSEPTKILSVEASQEIIRETRRFIKETFTKDIDYEESGKGKFKRRTLLKPGAEKLSVRFNLRPAFQLMDKQINWEEKIFYFEFSCKLIHVPTEVTMGEYIASCNSREEKYRYRWLMAKELSPGTDKDSLVKKERQSVSGNRYMVYRMDNPYVEDQINTISGIGQKRAFVGAVRIATGTSDMFTEGWSESNGEGTLPETKMEEPEEKALPTEINKIKADLYAHFLGDEEVVQEFLQKALRAKGTIPLEKLPSKKLEIVKMALQAEKLKTKAPEKKEDDDDLPFR